MGPARAPGHRLDVQEDLLTPLVRRDEAETSLVVPRSDLAFETDAAVHARARSGSVPDRTSKVFMVPSLGRCADTGFGGRLVANPTG
jgi:hypothetical protein